MNSTDKLAALFKIKTYCEKEKYKGWDPFDGLNSRIFQALPYFKTKPFWRLCVIQGFKRCPVNLRRIAMIPKEHNAKGIGLFLQGYCNLLKIVRQWPNMIELLGTEYELKAKVCDVAELLIAMQSKGGYHGACWGYNFDWQARGGLFFPAYTPTVVATNFCATALMEAYEVTGVKRYLDIALTSAEFLMQDLHRHECEEGFLFSYSPLPGNDTVYNASLLGSRLLAYCYHYTGNQEYLEAAKASVSACCKAQAADGSWIYGLGPTQGWIDSYHTGYNLDGLIGYEEMTGDKSFHKHIEKGYHYYKNHFFDEDGEPWHFIGHKYPIDIHCPGQLLVTMARLHEYNKDQPLAEKVLCWAITNMQDKKGYFYYQLKKPMSTKISYMRWSNAFMFCAMSYYLLESK
jgi:rhamnogalacturonyl hydrolase YesR